MTGDRGITTYIAPLADRTVVPVVAVTLPACLEQVPLWQAARTTVRPTLDRARQNSLHAFLA